MFSEDYIFLNLDVKTKEEALEFVSEKALELHLTDDERGLFEDFMKREELPTGLLDGFAIPHVKSDYAKETAIFYVSLKNPLKDWETFDQKPVTRFFALIVPKEAGDLHLMMISRLATSLMEEDFKNALLTSTDRQVINESILNAMKEEK